MLTQPFGTLGIGPTDDVRAIKLAYAKALKQCRPDDDPQGYQRLREALEWALELARSSSDESTAASPADVSNADSQDRALASSGDADASSAGVEELNQAEERDWIDPGELAHSLHRYWQEKGDEALVAAWPDLHYQLDRIPLGLRHDASNWFASLVLESPGLPRAFLKPLADYFQWGEDFRSDAMLGEQRARALGERLRDARVRQVLNPALRARFAELLHLKKLMDAGERLRAVIFAALASPKNGQRLAEATPEVLRSLRLDDTDVADIRDKLLLAFLLRVLPLAVLFGGLVLASTNQDWRRAIGLAFLCMAVAPIVAGGVDWLRGCVDSLNAWLPARWRQARPGPWRCAASVTVAALIGVLPPLLDAGPLLTFGILCGCLPLALLLAWSPVLAWRDVLLPIAIALFIALAALMGDEWTHPLSAAFAIALTWTLSAHWAFLSRPAEVLGLYSAPLQIFLPSTVLGWIFTVLFIKGIAAVVAAFVVLCLPLTYLVQSLSFGARYASITLALAIGVGLLFRELGQPWFYCLLLAPLVTAALQGICKRLSQVQWLHVAATKD